MPKQIFIQRNQTYNSKTQDIVQISSEPGWLHSLVPNEEDVWVVINGLTFSMQRIDEANNKIEELAVKIKILEEENKDLREEVNILRGCLGLNEK
jgi:hypothetical protein